MVNKQRHSFSGKAVSRAALLVMLLTTAACSNEIDEMQKAEQSAAVEQDKYQPASTITGQSVASFEEQLLKNGFDEAYLLQPAQGSRIQGMKVLGEDELAYAISGESETTLYRYNYRTNHTTVLGSVASGNVTLQLSVQQDLEAIYWNGERRSYATWSLASGEENKEPKIILAENQKWTLYRSNEGSGIWAAENEGSKAVHLTNYEMDNTPLWIPNSNRFVYDAFTGNTIADGSGYEFALAFYDLDTMKNEWLLLDRGTWKIRGWLEPGKKLLVDHAFNEGESVDYTVPYVVDLETMKETPLQPQQEGAYNMAFSPTKPAFVTAVAESLTFYDNKAQITASIPWLTESAEQLSRRFVYSPDGSKGLYTMRAEDGSMSEAGERMIVIDADGSNGYRINDKAVNLVEVEWTPDGLAIVAVVEQDGKLYIAVRNM